MAIRRYQENRLLLIGFHRKLQALNGDEMVSLEK